MEHYAHEQSQAERLAIGLGLFSIGLGLAELTSPGSIARLAGVRVDDRSRNTIRWLGAREIANGAAILANPRSAVAVWSRVGGDALDLSLLARAARPDDAPATRQATAAAAAVFGVTVLDLLCAVQLSGENAASPENSTGEVHVEHVATIRKPIEEVYRYWMNFENFPRFMQHLESVQTIGEGRTRWRAKAPAGMTVQWDADIVDSRENERIAWESVEGSGIQNSGVVTFEHAPGARGTEVRVHLHYVPPAGALGRAIAKLFGEEPHRQLRDDLRRFKQLMETGEIPLSDGIGLMRPAQPARRPEDIRTLAGVE